MTTGLNFKLTDLLDKPFSCICGEEKLVLGYVHEGGEDHPQCEDCVRKWTAAKDTPDCAICRKAINASSVLSPKEAQQGTEKRKRDRIKKSQRQCEEDERVARELVGEDTSAFEDALFFIGARDEDFARRFQAQEYRKQNPFCNCTTYVLAAVIFVSGVAIINSFKG